MSLQARASGRDLPGTWGFGFWNDPFSVGALAGGGMRLPALPEAAWFFFASAECYLSLRDDLPANGGRAAAFRSSHVPSICLASGVAGLPLLLIGPGRRWLRRLGRNFIQEAAVQLTVDPSIWHAYRLEWRAGQAVFQVDNQPVLSTPVSPRGPLGVVIWIDNQYLAFQPSGALKYGMLPNPEIAWIEIRELQLRSFDGA
jgi:hypothetical protein